ncbi:YeeE/YedE family protein [Dyella kyungheensis]|uniref:YeeE/YedE family protein n=1 Tax=Dyella kyungheensis TaxID=1242174 RepID=A0ABS2JXX6_9GAMM|nr:YeeE/YedE thiosulfate transporter family protein [Dyella kyungheensis]MBM7123388.1 YeeE/YedE family protein [Dyella kyungheensis]
MHPWISSLMGGVMIGLSAVWLMAALGRIAGISGIASGLLAGAGDREWRIAFLIGVVAAPWLLLLLRGESVIGAPVVSLPWMAAAGVLVGFGTRLGGGCTSGHGVCGVARLSRRSLLATALFVAAAMATVFVIRHLLGGLGT